MLAQNVTSVGMGRRNAFLLCLCSRNCIIIITIIVFVVVVVMFQNRQLIVTSLGYCWYSGGGSPQSPNCWSSCNVWREMGVGEDGV